MSRNWTPSRDDCQHSMTGQMFTASISERNCRSPCFSEGYELIEAVSDSRNQSRISEAREWFARLSWANLDFGLMFANIDGKDEIATKRLFDGRQN
jgi:hypothetical protein